MFTELTRMERREAALEAYERAIASAKADSPARLVVSGYHLIDHILLELDRAGIELVRR